MVCNVIANLVSISIVLCFCTPAVNAGWKQEFPVHPGIDFNAVDIGNGTIILDSQGGVFATEIVDDKFTLRQISNFTSFCDTTIFYAAGGVICQYWGSLRHVYYTKDFVNWKNASLPFATGGNFPMPTVMASKTVVLIEGITQWPKQTIYGSVDLANWKHVPTPPGATNMLLYSTFVLNGALYTVADVNTVYRFDVASWQFIRSDIMMPPGFNASLLYPANIHRCGEKCFLCIATAESGPIAYKSRDLKKWERYPSIPQFGYNLLCNETTGICFGFNNGGVGEGFAEVYRTDTRSESPTWVSMRPFASAYTFTSILLHEGKLVAAFMSGTLGWIDQIHGSPSSWSFLTNAMPASASQVIETDSGLLINGLFMYQGERNFEMLNPNFAQDYRPAFSAVEYARLPHPKPPNPTNNKICSMIIGEIAQVSCDYTNYDKIQFTCTRCYIYGAPIPFGGSYTAIVMIPGGHHGWYPYPAQYAVYQITNGVEKTCIDWSESELSIASTGTEIMLTVCSQWNCTLMTSTDGCQFTMLQMTSSGTWTLSSTSSSYYYMDGNAIRGMDKDGTHIDTSALNSRGPFNQIRYSLATDSILLYNPNVLVKANSKLQIVSSVFPMNMTWYEGYIYTDTPGIGEALIVGYGVFVQQNSTNKK